MSPDRRTFVRRALLLGMAAPAAGAWACARPPAEDPATEATDGDGPRPLLRAWSHDAVHLPAPLGERPMAYLSAGERRLYIERGYRSRVERLLGAYISTTTGHWRIHLLGDDTRVPVPPGDEAREFEELDLTAWDPARPPSEGDIRIAFGRSSPVAVSLSCSPVLGDGGWVTAPPFTVDRVSGSGGEGIREYFGQVTRGIRHVGRKCDSAGDGVRVLSWGSRGQVSVPEHAGR